MALEAGELVLILEFGQNLKDCDWFGKQDPYCILTCGTQKLRSRTAIDGGKNPVWNETFKFNVINENDISFVLMDEDTLARDDVIGQGRISIAKARIQGRDHMQVPVYSKKGGRQHGIIAVSLYFTRNQAPAAPQYGAASYHYAPSASALPLYYSPAPYGFSPAAPPYAYPPQQPPSLPQAQQSFGYTAAVPSAPSCGYGPAPVGHYAPQPPAGYAAAASSSFPAYPYGAATTPPMYAAPHSVRA